ncbi:MAG: lysylphosphatidylglycerol synthase transmembrane domain-containing protein [Chloroflexota bacterium]
MRGLINAKTLIGVAISLVCLWLALRDVPLGDLGQAMAGGNYVWLIPAIGLQLLSVLARAQRWAVLLGQLGRLADAFWAEGIGYLFTNIFPLRLGEPARVLVMSDRCKLPFFQVAGSAVLERLLDVATMVVVLLLVLPWMTVPTLVARAGMTFAALVLLALVVVVLLARFGTHSEALLIAIGSRFRFLPIDRLVIRWRELVVGLARLTELKVLLPACGWSAITWALTIGVYWCAMHAFAPRATAIEASFMVVALAFAIAVPSSPGFIGVFQLIGQQALVIPFGAKYSMTEALAITVTAYLTYYLFSTTLGVVGLARLGQSFANVGRAALSRPAIDAEVGG